MTINKYNFSTFVDFLRLPFTIKTYRYGFMYTTNHLIMITTCGTHMHAVHMCPIPPSIDPGPALAT